MDQHKLDQIINLVGRELPDATNRDIEAFVYADWPEGQEHLQWLRTAPVAEIVTWVVVGLRDGLAERRSRRDDDAELSQLVARRSQSGRSQEEGVTK